MTEVCLLLEIPFSIKLHVLASRVRKEKKKNKDCNGRKNLQFEVQMT